MADAIARDIAINPGGGMLPSATELVWSLYRHIGTPWWSR